MLTAITELRTVQGRLLSSKLLVHKQLVKFLGNVAR